MAHTNNRLNALSVARLRTKGLYHDGDGLYLQVAVSGSRSWVLRFMLNGRAREMGLGSLRDVSLAQARTKASEARRLRTDGIDPIENRHTIRHGARLAAARAMTFAACSEAYVKANSVGWRNAKHVAQWISTLRTYAFPVFGSLSVQDIDTALVLRVLEPIWKEKTETASRSGGGSKPFSIGLPLGGIARERTPPGGDPTLRTCFPSVAKCEEWNTTAHSHTGKLESLCTPCGNKRAWQV